MLIVEFASSFVYDLVLVCIRPEQVAQFLVVRRNIRGRKRDRFGYFRADVCLGPPVNLDRFGQCSPQPRVVRAVATVTEGDVYPTLRFFDIVLQSDLDAELGVLVLGGIGASLEIFA